MENLDERLKSSMANMDERLLKIDENIMKFNKADYDFAV